MMLKMQEVDLLVMLGMLAGHAGDVNYSILVARTENKKNVQKKENKLNLDQARSIWMKIPEHIRSTPLSPSHPPAPLSAHFEQAGQNQWFHFGVGAPPVLVYLSGGLGCSLGAHQGFDPWPVRVCLLRSLARPRSAWQEAGRSFRETVGDFFGAPAFFPFLFLLLFFPIFFFSPLFFRVWATGSKRCGLGLNIGDPQKLGGFFPTITKRHTHVFVSFLG